MSRKNGLYVTLVFCLTGFLGFQLLISEEEVITGKNLQKKFKQIVKTTNVKDYGSSENQENKFKVELIFLSKKNGNYTAVEGLLWNLLSTKKKGKFEKMSYLYGMQDEEGRLRFKLKPATEEQEKKITDGYLTEGKKYKLHVERNKYRQEEFILKMPTIKKMKKKDRKILYYPITLPDSFIEKDKKTKHLKKL